MRKITISITGGIVGAGLASLATLYILRQKSKNRQETYYDQRVSIPLQEHSEDSKSPLWVPLEDGALWVIGEDDALTNVCDMITSALHDQPTSSLSVMNSNTLEAFEAALLAMSHRDQGDSKQVITPVFIPYQEWMSRSSDFCELVKRSGEQGIIVIVLSTPGSLTSAHAVEPLRKLTRLVFLAEPLDVEISDRVFKQSYMSKSAEPRPPGLYSVISYR